MLDVFVEPLAERAVEADADGDLVAVHDFDKGIELLGGMSQADEEVGMDIDDWEFGPGKMMFFNLEHRLRPKGFQRQRPAILAIERRIWRLLGQCEVCQHGSDQAKTGRQPKPAANGLPRGGVKEPDHDMDHRSSRRSLESIRWPA